jgi:hypothetical protein
MLHKIIFQRRAKLQFQSICDYLVEEFGERVACRDTLVIAAFADMRMHPDNVLKAVIG